MGENGLDILLDKDGDIAVSAAADITVNYSVRQQVKILLQWFFEEWRFAPSLGLPYFEEVFVKNPNTKMIAQIVRAEVMKAAHVKNVEKVTVNVNNTTRHATINFVFVTDYGKEELEINV